MVVVVPFDGRVSTSAVTHADYSYLVLITYRQRRRDQTPFSFILCNAADELLLDEEDSWPSLVGRLLLTRSASSRLQLRHVRILPGPGESVAPFYGEMSN